MGITFLLDEHLRGPLWRAIRRHNATAQYLLDAVRVGDADAPSLSTADPDLLLWSEQSGRILVTFDEKTFPGHLAEHLQAGHHSPGVFLVRPERSLKEVLEFLVLAAAASESSEWAGKLTYIP